MCPVRWPRGPDITNPPALRVVSCGGGRPGRGDPEPPPNRQNPRNAAKETGRRAVYCPPAETRQIGQLDHVPILHRWPPPDTPLKREAPANPTSAPLEMMATVKRK